MEIILFGWILFTLLQGPCWYLLFLIMVWRLENQSINQLIMGGIHWGARCLTYPMMPPLVVTPRESSCRLRSHTKRLPAGGIDLPQPRDLWASPWPSPSWVIPFGNNPISILIYSWMSPSSKMVRKHWEVLLSGHTIFSHCCCLNLLNFWQMESSSCAWHKWAVVF